MANLAAIQSFTGKWSALASHNLLVSYEGVGHPSFDHARVAAKTNDLARRKIIAGKKRAREAILAGSRGSGTVMRPDWKEVQDAVTNDLVMSGTVGGTPAIQQLLLATGEAYLENRLINGQYREQFYSGGANGRQGANSYGKAMMAARGNLCAAADMGLPAPAARPATACASEARAATPPSQPDGNGTSSGGRPSDTATARIFGHAAPPVAQNRPDVALQPCPAQGVVPPPGPGGGEQATPEAGIGSGAGGGAAAAGASGGRATCTGGRAEGKEGAGGGNSTGGGTVAAGESGGGRAEGKAGAGEAAAARLEGAGAGAAGEAATGVGTGAGQPAPVLISDALRVAQAGHKATCAQLAAALAVAASDSLAAGTVKAAAEVMAALKKRMGKIWHDVGAVAKLRAKQAVIKAKGSASKAKVRIKQNENKGAAAGTIQHGGTRIGDSASAAGAKAAARRDTAKQPCLFWHTGREGRTPGGCQEGDRCEFLHDENEAAAERLRHTLAEAGEKFRGEKRKNASSGTPDAKRTKIDGRRETGVVKTWREDGGFGFIQGPAGVDVFCHASEVKDGNSLRQGARVTFTMGVGQGGRAQATEVHGGHTAADAPGHQRHGGRRQQNGQQRRDGHQRRGGHQGHGGQHQHGGQQGGGGHQRHGGGRQQDCRSGPGGRRY